ncbi:MAG: 6,7-dimethyl-8-ribityllumazine synthase [Candidatus Pelagibacterales bacterium]|jgi:6,7-dimethyl-8-ribityllumazine synthase|tara:strand:- start:1108 stop:1527 length:420 start_codon:yes stop_codon:yes gene_type:complete
MSKNKYKVLIVASGFYKDITTAMIKSAEFQLKKHDCSYKIYRVQGALEIPTLIAIKLKKEKYDGAIALGCIIKGQTSHNEVIASTITNSLLNISTDNLKPVGNAVLSCNNLKQAIARTKGSKNRAAEAVDAIISVLGNI